jgi:hypothetical protein
MITTTTIERSPMMLRAAIAAGAVLGLFIVLMTLLRYPASPSQTVLYYVALALFAVCIVIPVVGLRPSSRPGQRATWRFSALFGLLIGALWMVEIFTGNLIAVGSSASIGVYRLSTLLAFALPLVAGVIGAYTERRVRSGIAIGFWSGLISGLIAFFTLMAVAYLFMGTMQHDPQTLREYAHSGERTLSTYIVGDFLVGGCSHLLLIGMVYGTILAAIGAVVGKAAAAASPTR